MHVLICALLFIVIYCAAGFDSGVIYKSRICITALSAHIVKGYAENFGAYKIAKIISYDKGM